MGSRWDRPIHRASLTQAQQLANEKKAVVAVYQNANSVGHVALVLPGNLEASGSWGLSVPNAASFFLPEPSRSFVNKGLSFAFTQEYAERRNPIRS